MNATVPTRRNPLAAIAMRVAVGTAIAVSTLSRLAGAVVLLGVAFSESYDRTQVFAPSVAALVLLTLLRPAHTLAAFFAAGLLFFAGTSLIAVDASWLVLAAGVLALASASLPAAREARSLVFPALAFFAAAATIVALVVVVALLIEG